MNAKILCIVSGILVFIAAAASVAAFLLLRKTDMCEDDYFDIEEGV